MEGNPIDNPWEFVLMMEGTLCLGAAAVRRYKGNRFFQAVLVALGCAEREMAISAGTIGNWTIRPLCALSLAWVGESNDRSPESEIANALAGVRGEHGKIGPLRIHLEPVDWQKGSRDWAKRDRSVVWTSADLETNLASVLGRRLMDGQKAGCKALPLGSSRFASLEAIAAFLAGDTDDRKIEDLLWGLILVRHEGWIERRPPPASFPLPRAYALLRLLFLPHRLTLDGSVYDIRPEPAILSLLAADRVGDACRIALRRLRASGLVPMPYARSGSATRDHDWQAASFSQLSGRRLAAALLIPVSDDDAGSLAELVVRPSETKQ